MTLTAEEIKKILLQGNYVTDEDMKAAEEYSKEYNVPLSTDYFIAKNLLTKNLIGQAIAEYYKTSYADFEIQPPTPDDVAKIPEEIAKKYGTIVYKEDLNKVSVATSQLNNKNEILKELWKIFAPKHVYLMFAFDEDLQNFFVHYRKSLDSRFKEIVESHEKIAPEIINEIIEDAIALRCSDIHFEPIDKNIVKLRFRIDGVLYEVGTFPKNIFENILNRIKVQAKMRIDEHYSAQDGAIRFVSAKNETADLRISIIPTLEGEKIAIRVLSQYLQFFNLGDLGLSDKDQEILMSAAKKPFGMILTTGPTGSGKTTTLYGLLKLINNPKINITTIEDPVEYKVPGVNQIQVNAQTNLTFAQGLRSIVRQDPNVILVGEIRDEETAEIAVNSALTGHLLLSTFHANDSATAIPRLFDMGIEPFLLASTLNIIISQRLIRRLCTNCRISSEYKLSELKELLPSADKYFSEEKITLYKGAGCQVCNYSGYRGRTAVFEIIYNTREMQDLILSHPSSAQIWDLAKKQGAHSFFEDGVEKLKSGITTIEELLRVAPVDIGTQIYESEK